MKKLMLVEAILNGLVRIIKAIRCKSSCCIESSCGERRSNSPEVETAKLTKENLKYITEV